LYAPGCAPSQQDTSPIVTAFTDAGFTPPDPTTFDRNELRRLVQRGALVNIDGIYFASVTLDAAHAVARSLLADNAGGFSASQFREALGTTRKYAIPLAEALDARGITRRRGDIRIPGPRL
jgi:selenocysteine-specific elongation factor